MDPVLCMLSSGEYISGERISETLGVTRAAVWKRIRGLQEDGWPIVSGGRRGYRLGDHDRLEPETWQGSLTTRAVGRGTVHYERTLVSTNATIKHLLIDGAPSGTVCLCEEQTGGRGRMNRVWESPPGVGLWVSVGLKVGITPSWAQLMTFCAALAMSDALAETCDLQVGVKWPNDLVFRGKKLCGILLEASTDMDSIRWVVVGTGLNVLPGSVPAALREQAGCVAEFADPPPRRVILAHYLQALERWTGVLEQEGPEPIVRAVTDRCVTLGQQVMVVGPDTFTGLAVGIDKSGVLMVRDETGGNRMVLAGDVSVRGIMGYA